MKSSLKRGLWSPEEDEKLVNCISTHGLHGSWSVVPILSGLQRSGKSCRLRWTNYLRPGLRQGNFSSEEAILIINLHNNLGNKWAEIAKYLPGRTDSAIKNFCNSNLTKKLLAANPKIKRINNTLSYHPFHKGFRNQNPYVDLIFGQKGNLDTQITPFKSNEMKGMVSTVSQPNDWLKLISGEIHNAPSTLAKSGEQIEIKTDLDVHVDLPPLPPSLMGDPCSVLDQHPQENFDLILGQNWDPNHLLMQLEPCEINNMDLIIDTISHTNI